MASSSIILQAGALQALDHHLPELAKYSQYVLLLHPSLKRLYGHELISSLKRLKRPILEISIPRGEQSKSLRQAKRCWELMVAHQVDRRSAVIALGGGVISDLAGFVASCYMRGLDSFYLPTTLLAMVDAAVGGKTGVNLPNLKNAIGTFHSPQAIVIDPTALLSLPQRDFCSGLAEIIKYGMISDSLLVEKLENHLDELKDQKGTFLEEIVRDCIEIKRAIVAQDEKDVLGKRAALNYGHTFGHAIEAMTDYCHYLHGEAVAIGMSCAVNLSARLGICDPALIERQDALCRRAHLSTGLPALSIECLIARMRNDKKAIYGKINLILLERIGKVVTVCDVDSMLIKQVLLTKINR